jgi:hypothetical protein
MDAEINLGEYPAGYKGRQSFVFVPSLGRVIARCYTYFNGRNSQLLPEYGGPAIRNTRSGTVSVMRDIGEYTSTIDGTRITSRSQHREHIRQHDVIEVGTERIGSMGTPQDSGGSIGHEIKRVLQGARG